MIRVDDKAERSQRGNPSTSRSTARSDWHGRTKVDVSKGAATFARVSDDGRGEVYVPDAFIRGTSSERAAISERLLSGNASGLGSFAQRGFVRFGFTLDSTTRVRQPYIESPWIRAALKAISGGFVQLKPRIYDRDPADADAVEIQVPELTRLLRRPNRVQTQRQLQKALAIEAKLTGDVFWFLLNASGEPIKVDEEGFWKEWPAGIMPAASRYVEHKLDRETGMPAAYRYRVASSAGASGSHSEAFPPGAVVHFIDYDPDTLVRGRGDVESIMRDVDLYFQVSRYLDASVRSGGQPGGVVTYKERLSPYEIDARQQSLEDELANGHQGAWRILDADARFTPNPVTPKDMEYGGLLEWLRDVKLSGLGVPPPVLGIYADATLNNVETAYRELWRGPNGVLTLAVDTADVITQSFLYRASKLNRALEDAVFVWDSSDVEDLRTEQVDQVVKAAEVVSKGIGVSLNGTLAGMGV
ncbi:MAG: phage portal protein, partial [Planctomycetota bacterium]